MTQGTLRIFRLHLLIQALTQLHRCSFSPWFHSEPRDVVEALQWDGQKYCAQSAPYASCLNMMVKHCARAPCTSCLNMLVKHCAASTIRFCLSMFGLVSSRSHKAVCSFTARSQVDQISLFWNCMLRSLVATQETRGPQGIWLVSHSHRRGRRLFCWQAGMRAHFKSFRLIALKRKLNMWALAGNSQVASRITAACSSAFQQRNKSQKSNFHCKLGTRSLPSGSSREGRQKKAGGAETRWSLRSLLFACRFAPAWSVYVVITALLLQDTKTATILRMTLW